MGRRRLLALVGLGLFLAGFGEAAAAEPTPPVRKEIATADAGQFIQGLAEQAITGLTDPSITPSQRSERFRNLLARGFDVPAIARFALGRYWRSATDAQRQEYMKLFEELTVQTYANRFTEYAGEKLKIVQTRSANDGEVVVASDLLRPTGPPVKVDWRLRREDADFKIFDVVVEGVSMSITQRDEFSAVIQRSGGIDGLLTSLRDKVHKAGQ